MSTDLELQERLGRNSMAEVWKAFDPQLQRYVALKIFHADLQSDPNFITRFQNLPRVHEAQLIISLNHPNIVKILSFNITPPSESESVTPYIVMDYVEGPTLADYIRDTSHKGAFPSAGYIVHLFASIGAAIDYAHQHGVIHGDLKPTNILLNTDNTSRNPIGEPMLTDFGIARLFGTYIGTLSRREPHLPFYISPEQVQGHPAAEHSDIYSLGVILYEICTGLRPFQGEVARALIMQHIHTMPIPPEALNPNISPALSAVILRSLAKNPEERFLSATSLVAALAWAFGISAPEAPSQRALDANPLAQQVVEPPIEGEETPTLTTNPRVQQPPALAEETSMPVTDVTGQQTPKTEIAAPTKDLSGDFTRTAAQKSQF